MNRQMSTFRGESEKAKYQRTIENQLDKALLRQREAEHVKAIYDKIKNTLRTQAGITATLIVRDVKGTGQQNYFVSEGIFGTQFGLTHHPRKIQG